MHFVSEGLAIKSDYCVFETECDLSRSELLLLYMSLSGQERERTKSDKQLVRALDELYQLRVEKSVASMSRLYQERSRASALFSLLSVKLLLLRLSGLFAYILVSQRGSDNFPENESTFLLGSVIEIKKKF